MAAGFKSFYTSLAKHDYTTVIDLIIEHGIMIEDKHVFRFMNLKHLVYKPLFDVIMNRTDFTYEIINHLFKETKENPIILSYMMELDDETGIVDQVMKDRVKNIVNPKSIAVIADSQYSEYLTQEQST